MFRQYVINLDDAGLQNASRDKLADKLEGLAEMMKNQSNGATRTVHGKSTGHGGHSNNATLVTTNFRLWDPPSLGGTGNQAMADRTVQELLGDKSTETCPELGERARIFRILSGGLLHDMLHVGRCSPNLFVTVAQGGTDNFVDRGASFEGKPFLYEMPEDIKALLHLIFGNNVGRAIHYWAYILACTLWIMTTSQAPDDECLGVCAHVISMIADRPKRDVCGTICDFLCALSVAMSATNSSLKSIGLHNCRRGKALSGEEPPYMFSSEAAHNVFGAVAHITGVKITLKMFMNEFIINSALYRNKVSFGKCRFLEVNKSERNLSFTTTTRGLNDDGSTFERKELNMINEDHVEYGLPGGAVLEMTEEHPCIVVKAAWFKEIVRTNLGGEPTVQADWRTASVPSKFSEQGDVTFKILCVHRYGKYCYPGYKHEQGSLNGFCRDNLAKPRDRVDPRKILSQVKDLKPGEHICDPVITGDSFFWRDMDVGPLSGIAWEIYDNVYGNVLGGSPEMAECVEASAPLGDHPGSSPSMSPLGTPNDDGFNSDDERVRILNYP